MKKNIVRNIILKILTYSFIISAIPYSYFLWHAKQGIDAYLVTRGFEVKLDYSWLWINHEGEINLENVRIYKTRKKPIIKALRLKISHPSIFDLIDSREQVVYKTYPNQIKLSIIGASTNKPDVALNIFGIPFKKEYINLFFPQKCTVDSNIKLPNLIFDLSTTFKIQQTADIAVVDFSFKDSQFATIKGTFNINRLFETGINTTYLSDLKIRLDDLTWLQQHTQVCLQKINLERNKLTIFYRDFLDQNALDSNLALDKVASQEISDFFYKPENITITFDINEGKTYNQITLDPAYNFQKRVGLSIDLNEKNIGSVFSEKFRASIEEVLMDDNGVYVNPLKNTAKNNNKNLYISKNKRSLTSYLGSKIKINLYSGRTHSGYLESISRDQILLKKLEYRGKSTLPFEYSKIKSIELLVAEN